MLALPACDDSLDPPRECFAPFSITVSGGTTPDFTWTAPCGLARLVVARTNGNVVAWDIVSESRRILSPISYGEVPPGTREETGPLPLDAGVTYQVRLYNDDGIAIAASTFVP
jgi:hypothetical protein